MEMLHKPDNKTANICVKMSHTCNGHIGVGHRKQQKPAYRISQVNFPSHCNVNRSMTFKHCNDSFFT